MTYPAVCPGCGSIAVDVLYSDPRVPIYRCGATGDQPCIRPTATGPALVIAPDGLDELTRADRMDLLLVVDLATGAALRRP
jgi:hypothetical protein